MLKAVLSTFPVFEVGWKMFWNFAQPAGITRTSTIGQDGSFIIWSLFQSWKHCKCTWIFKDSCSEERVGSEYCQSSIWLIWNYCKLPQKSFLLVLEVDAKQWPHNMMRSIALLTFFSYYAVKKITFCAMIIISTKNVKQLKSENNNRDCPLYIIFVSTNWSMTTNV